MTLECAPGPATRQAREWNPAGNALLPTFIIAGAARSGTSSLHSWLGQHPDVFMSPIKETNFFAQLREPMAGPGDEAPRAPLRRDGAGRIVPRGAAYIVEAAEYRSVFAGSEGFSARGEASPSYLYYAHCAGAIRHALPECKIVVMLREPIARLVSNYNALCTWGRESRSLMQALELESDRMRLGWEWIWDLRGGSSYATMLEPYLAAFPREQIGIWLFEDLKAKPAETYASICRFIGADPERFRPAFTTENPSLAGPRLAGLSRKVSLVSRVCSHLPQSVRAMARPMAARALGGDYSTLTPAMTSSLIDLFEVEANRLEQLVPQLSLAGWREAWRRATRD